MTSPAEATIRAALAAGYGLEATGLERIAAGTATGNLRAETGSGPVFVKIYPDSIDLGRERKVLEVSDSARLAGIPVPQLLRASAGQLMCETGGLAMSVWEWRDSDPHTGPLTDGQAFEVGRVLARLHIHLRQFDSPGWPAAQPHYLRHTLNQITARFRALQTHIATTHSGDPQAGADCERIAVRIRQLIHMPDLIEGATAPRRVLVHGDYVRPNWLLYQGKLAGIVDMRLKRDDPVRELGRAAFDVTTVATSPDWLAVAASVLAGYLEVGGIVTADQLFGCARHAVLHSIASTYPVEDLYLNPPGEHLLESQREYWEQRHSAVTTMLEQLGEIDAMTASLGGRRRTPAPQPATVPADPRVLLPAAALARAYLLRRIQDNAQIAGVKALLHTGPYNHAESDPLSTLDVIAITDGTSNIDPAVLMRSLVEPAPLLFAYTWPQPGPEGAHSNGFCAQVADWPVWVNMHLWPANAAVIPADAHIIFNAAGLPQVPETIAQLFGIVTVQIRHLEDETQADPVVVWEDERGSADLVSAMFEAKRRARLPYTYASTVLEPIDLTGIPAVDRYVAWCQQLAGTAWDRNGWHAEILRYTSKSTVARITSGHGTVIGKLRTTADPYWRERFENERTVYRLAATGDRPPFGLRSTSFYSDPAMQLLTASDGVALHTDRYPALPLDEHHVLAAIRTLQRFAAWTPPPGTLADPGGEAHRISNAAAMLEPADRAAYEFLCGFTKTRRLQHGDALPSNLLIDERGMCTLTDFEHTAVGKPGWDLAVLRVVLSGQSQQLLSRIDEWAERKAGHPAYAAGLITAAAREMQLHLHVFPLDASGTRDRVVSAAWEHALHRLRTLPMTQHIYRSYGGTDAKP